MVEKCETRYFEEAIYEKFNPVLKKRRSEINAIFASGSQWSARERGKRIRDRLKKLISIDFERCPLDPQLTGIIECEDYIIEKILYQVFPGSYVPANVYRPKQIEGKLPAVLVAMGHWPQGKALLENQIFCANLCRNGFVVMVFDPQYQGEREVISEDLSDIDRQDYICVANHMKTALPQFLMGKSFMAHYLWDGICAIDYLQSRQDVDGERIGMTGQSGGGTQTSFITALDSRIKVASIMQYLTSTEEDFHWNGVGEAEQAIFGLHEYGYDKADLVWCAAPRPVLVNAAVHDEIFPIEGVMRLKDELKELYTLYGIPERLELVLVDSMHQIVQQTREGSYYWMNKWLRKQEGFLPEKEVQIFSLEELACEYKERNQCDAVDWNIQAMAEIKKRWCILDKNSSRTALMNFFDKVERERFQYYTISSKKEDGYEKTDFRIHTEKSYDIDGTFYCRDEKDQRVVVVLDMNHQGIDPISLLKQGNVLELRPFGSFYTVRENHRIRFDLQSQCVHTIWAGGRDMIQIRVNEILCALEHVRLTLNGISDIIFQTTGQGGVLALISGLYEDQISEIRMDHMMASYSAVVENRNTFINDADIIVGFLKQFDLVHLLQANAGRNLIIEHPVDAYGNEMDGEKAMEFYNEIDFVHLV